VYEGMARSWERQGGGGGVDEEATMGMVKSRLRGEGGRRSCHRQLACIKPNRALSNVGP
jgi:hypothetical protein